MLCYSAVAGMDYDAIPIPDPLVFPSSSTEGMELCAMIGIIDDTALEGEHSFSVHITSTSPEITVGMAYATVEIQDNERKKTSYTGTHQFCLYIFTISSFQAVARFCKDSKTHTVNSYFRHLYGLYSPKGKGLYVYTTEDVAAMLDVLYTPN